MSNALHAVTLSHLSFLFLASNVLALILPVQSQFFKLILITLPMKVSFRFYGLQYKVFLVWTHIFFPKGERNERFLREFGLAESSFLLVCVFLYLLVLSMALGSSSRRFSEFLSNLKGLVEDLAILLRKGSKVSASWSCSVFLLMCVFLRIGSRKSWSTLTWDWIL